MIKFWGSRKLYADFLLCGELAPLTPVLFKGQLYKTALERSSIRVEKSKALFMNPIKERKVRREENQFLYFNMSLASTVGQGNSENGW